MLYFLDKFISVHIVILCMLPLSKIVQGDCLEVMRGWPAESIDCIVTDPPYGLEFMGKDWDRAVPKVEVWRECLRVLKSGAFAFIMCTPRQDCLSHMLVNLESAGFNIGFTSLYWAYASGFPKAMNISKAVDKRLGAERQITGVGQGTSWKHQNKINLEQEFRPNDYYESKGSKFERKDTPTTSEGLILDGSFGGFQPKPAVEVILVAMKPLSERTYVDQALKNGKGVTWLDGARIPIDEDVDDPRLGGKGDWSSDKMAKNVYSGGYAGVRVGSSVKGRFPANLLVSDDVLNDDVDHKGVHITKPCNTPNLKTWSGTFQTNRGERGYDDSGSFSRYFDLDVWWAKRLSELPESVQKTYPFLICPKASKSERDKGLTCDVGLVEALHGNMDGSLNKRTSGQPKVAHNNHPTIKPLKLMSYLITLGSRLNDMVLDPFCGSGTTCLAAATLGRNWVGVELNGEYCRLARLRLADYVVKIV